MSKTKEFVVAIEEDDLELLRMSIGDPDRELNGEEEETDEELVKELFCVEGTNRDFDLRDRVKVRKFVRIRGV